MNASPSLDFDLMRATDKVGTALHPAGLLLQDLHPPAASLAAVREGAPPRRGPRQAPEAPARARVAHRVPPSPRRRAGGGRRRGRDQRRRRGRRAWGRRVLCDEGPEPGGRLLAEGGHDHARELVSRAREAGVEILSNAPALGAFDGLVPVWQGDTLHQVRARRIVYATGTIEQPLLFAGNDLPGVMLSGGALRLAALYAVRPGTRAVVAAVCDRGLEAALALQDAGVELAAVADLRTNGSSAAFKALERRSVGVMRGTSVVAAHGRKQVERVTLASRRFGEMELACDLLVVSGGSAPATSLLSQAGARTAYDEGRGVFALSDLPDDVLAAGEVAGAGGLEAAELSGALAGAEAAHALGMGDADSRDRAAAGRERLAELARRPAEVAVPPPVHAGSGGKCFACLCEDVTVKDIHLSVAEGYDSIELSKRYTTSTMGPCQGRMCQLPAVRQMAEETGQSLAQVGTTTSRPPWHSVPMGALAGRPFEPAKRSAIHGRHREQGATVMWAGDWRRAYDYGDPRGEALAVHEAGRAYRRVHARQADRARPGRGRAAGPALPEPLLEPEAGPGPLRRDRERRGAHRRRRHGLPSRRGHVLRHDHLVGRGGRVRVVLLVAGGLAARRAPHRCDTGPRRREPRGPARAGDHGEADGPRLLGRGVHVPGRQAGRRGRRAVPDPPHRLRRGGGLRAPLPGGARRAPVGRAAGGGRRARPAPVRARASAAASAAEDAHPGRAGHRLRVHPVRRGDALDREARQGGRLHREVGARAVRGGAAGDHAGGFHAGERARPDGGRGGVAPQRVADGTGHERSLLATARQDDRNGLGAAPSSHGMAPA